MVHSKIVFYLFQDGCEIATSIDCLAVFRLHVLRTGLLVPSLLLGDWGLEGFSRGLFSLFSSSVVSSSTRALNHLSFIPTNPCLKQSARPGHS